MVCKFSHLILGLFIYRFLLKEFLNLNLFCLSTMPAINSNVSKLADFKNIFTINSNKLDTNEGPIIKPCTAIMIRQFFLTIGFLALHLIKSSSQFIERQKYLKIKICNAKFLMPNSFFLILFLNRGIMCIFK